MNRHLTLSLVGILFSFSAQAAPAHVATSWHDVKYAFCESEGHAILIDFLGADLSTGVIGSAQLGMRECSVGKTYAWDKIEGVTIDWSQFGDFEIDLGNVGYIQGGSLWDWQHQDAFAMISAHQGQCFFLRDKGTQGLPFQSPCN